MAELRTYRAELHVHTVLSPCAGVEMIPPLIIAEAKLRSIDLIAITDHNTSANAAAVIAAAQGSRVHVLPGIELQTSEEVHLLCLFDQLAASAAFQAAVDQHLPNLPNRPDFFGEQFVVDQTGEFIRREERLLLASTTLSLDEAVHLAHAHGGLAIPAHIDRRAYGLIANLGFIPPLTPFDALEVSRKLDIADVAHAIPGAMRFPLLQSGDVHYLEDFLGAMVLTLAEPTIPEIRLALLQKDGRSLTHASLQENA
jgi:PHP family Zn ribbon phosphoesterase